MGMGFGMRWKKNNKERTKTKIRIYLKAATLAVALTALTNCSEEIKEELQPLGDIVMAEKIDDALGNASAGTHIYYAKPEQFVEYEGNYRVELGAVVKLDTIFRKYKGYTDEPTQIVFNLEESYFEFDRTGTIINQKHSEKHLPMKKAFDEAMSMSFSKSSVASDDPYCVRPEPTETKFDCVKYYNLKERDVNEPVPAMAAARANCSNIPGCVLPSKVIEFDRVKFLNGQFVEKEIYKFSISKKIPVLMPDHGFPPLNHFCISRLIDAGGSTYYITQCNVLRDLQL
jgi:hypothetical protein